MNFGSAWPSGAAAGQTAIVVIAIHNVSITMTTPASGWTLLTSGTASPMKVFFYGKVLVAGDLSAVPTWVQSGTAGYECVLGLFSGGDATTPYDPSSTWLGGTQSGSVTTTSYTTTVDGDMPVIGEGENQNTDISATTTGYTLFAHGTNAGNTTTTSATAAIWYMTGGQTTHGSVAVASITLAAIGYAAWQAITAASAAFYGYGNPFGASGQSQMQQLLVH